MERPRGRSVPGKMKEASATGVRWGRWERGGNALGEECRADGSAGSLWAFTLRLWLSLFSAIGSHRRFGANEDCDLI